MKNVMAFFKAWYSAPWSGGTVYDKAFTVALVLLALYIVVRIGREA